MLRILFKKIFSFHIWHNYSRSVDNWFMNWLISNSLIIRFLAPNFYKSGLVIRSDNVKIYLPRDKLDEGPHLAFAGIDYYKRLKFFFPKFNLHDSDVVIDAGANIGSFTIDSLVINPKIKIIALEPSNSIFEILKKNLGINLFQSINIHLLNSGLLDCECIVDFNHGFSSTTGSIPMVQAYKTKGDIKRSFINKDGLSCKIKCFDLKTIFDKYTIEQCKLLKLDIEGSEYRVLRSIDRNIWDAIEFLIVEAHPSGDGCPEDLIFLIQSNGFDVYKDVLNNGCVEIFAQRKSCDIVR